ncbi:hypothetical protein CI109_102989 [Kwoniella shandongensis]|uniref:Uncharacterized protein n=1 Tax=Kwoniella shandongensis TaxID=1734106 RepID=A0A5M6CD06_9TREE|nr:uncharacterized protein CI109_000176 [Kwoniella shandongensis]KAA5531335.1 hypothetical protein CI109_000176 [Kwoniella shandongensis]
MGEPDLVEKERLLNIHHCRWLVSRAASWSDCYIRLLYWFDEPDRDGDSNYWGEWVYIFCRYEPIEMLMWEWINANRPGFDISNFDLELDPGEYFLMMDKTPKDYRIWKYATIIIEDAQYIPDDEESDSSSSGSGDGPANSRDSGSRWDVFSGIKEGDEGA